MIAAEATSYTEAMAVIQSHVEGMGLRLTDFDDLAGFPSGLSGKVFGMLQVKRLGPEKLFDAMRAAGLRFRIEIDPEQRAKMLKRIAENYNPRQANQARACHAATTPSSAVLGRVFKAMGRVGGKRRWHKKTKEEISNHMRMMAMAGVRKRRKEQKRRARQRKRAHELRKAAAE